MTLPLTLFTLNHPEALLAGRKRIILQGDSTVTKKEIVKQISEELGLTQLKTKEIVQRTFEAIIETLLREKRIELRNFGVFEVKQRKARKARNPRTGEDVHVEPKNVVTFKPGKEMEERVRKMTNLPTMTEDDEELVTEGASNGDASDGKLKGKPTQRVAHKPE